LQQNLVFFGSDLPVDGTIISSESQLIGLVHDLTSNMDKNYQTDMIVLDFAKAFDKVSHPRLLYAPLAYRECKSMRRSVV
jgi:hypothetical protein